MSVLENRNHLMFVHIISHIEYLWPIFFSYHLATKKLVQIL